MPKTYSVAEARAHLPDLLDQVVAGASVHLTRRGRPVAVLVSEDEYAARSADRSRFTTAYRDFLTRHRGAEIGVDPDFARSLRDKSRGRRVRL